MLSSITPLGERGRNNRWALTVGAYVVGSLLGGGFLGAALGTVGSLLPRAPRAALAALAAAALVGLLVEAGRASFAMPTNHRQVNERWLDEYRGWVYGFGYGLQLGLGLITIVTSAATYLTFVAAFLSHSLIGGLVIGATFGLGRSLPVLLTRQCAARPRSARCSRATRGGHRSPVAWPSEASCARSWPQLLR